MRFVVREWGICVVLWGLIFQGVSAVPTEKDPKDQGDFQIENIQVTMELEHIQVSFLVRDSEGSFIRDLSMEDFVILENGKPQNIAVLKEQEVLISAVVMLDTSWSIENYLDDASWYGAGLLRWIGAGASGICGVLKNSTRHSGLGRKACQSLILL